MKVTMKDIKDAERALGSVLSHEIDFKLAYRMRKISNQLLSAIRGIEEYRQGLMRKYGKENEQKHLTVPPDQIDNFVKEFNAFLDTETDIDIQQIPLTCLEGLKISPIDVAVLEKFIEPSKTDK